MYAVNEVLRDLQVVVVEDESLIAEELRERLEGLGMKPVAVVDNGDGAVRAVVEHQPDLILMDIRLKGNMDGIEAATALKGGVQAPVLFLTAHSDRATLQRAKAVEPYGYILKPVNQRELEVALEMSIHRHELEKRLRESERRFATTLASIGDAVIATDPAGRITFINRIAEALTLWSAGEARGQPIDRVFAVIGADGAIPSPHPVLGLLDTRRGFSDHFEGHLYTREHELIPIDDSIAPILDGEGELLGAVVAFRDVRQRKLAEDALRKAEAQLRQAHKLEAVGRLAGGIAHDFNNLLTVINGSAELLLEEEGLTGMGRQSAEAILRTGERAVRMTRQLLSFNRNEIKSPEILHIGRSIADSSALIERLLNERIELEIRFDEDLGRVRLDEAHLEQVVLNLVVNAREAMPDGGRLSIEVENAGAGQEGEPSPTGTRAGDHVRLRVADTGVGMDDETREHIFEPFFTTREEGKGTGLGLATVYSIVKQWGGFVQVDSRPGEGATFDVYFPVSEEGSPVAASVNQRKEADHGEAIIAGTILVVEDDPDVQRMLITTLSRAGHQVLAAGSGEEALKVLASQAETIDLVMTDMIMGGMNGRELAERAARDYPGVRVLLTSGWSDDRKMHEGVRDNDLAFLRKPFTRTALLRKLEGMLRS